MTEMTKIRQIRAYMREGITRLPLDIQRHKIEQVAEKLGLRIEWYIGKTSKKALIADERDLWARQLGKNEIGVVYSLSVLRLASKHLSGADPKADFSGFVASLGGRYLMEASTGLTSKDRKKWRKAVTHASKRPLGTKVLTPKEASRISTKGWETRHRGVVYIWESEARESERVHLIRHWKASRTAKLAHAELSDFVEQMGGGVYNELIGISEPTLRRICNTKRTNR